MALAKLSRANEEAWLHIGESASFASAPEPIPMVPAAKVESQMPDNADKTGAAYEAVLRHNPGNIMALTQIARSHQKRQNFREAPAYPSPSSSPQLGLGYVPSAHKPLGGGRRFRTL